MFVKALFPGQGIIMRSLARLVVICLLLSVAGGTPLEAEEPPWVTFGEAWSALPSETQQRLTMQWRLKNRGPRRAPASFPKDRSAGKFATVVDPWEQVGPEGGQVFDVAWHPTTSGIVFAT